LYSINLNKPANNPTLKHSQEKALLVASFLPILENIKETKNSCFLFSFYYYINIHVANNAIFEKMRTQYLLVGLLILMVSVSGTTYVDLDKDYLEAPQNSFTFTNFDVKNLGDHDTLEISVEDSDSLYVAFSQNYFTENQDDNTLLIGVGSELGNHTVELEYTYRDYEEVTLGNKTEINLTDTETDTIELTVSVYIPMAMCFSKGVDTGSILRIGSIDILLMEVEADQITVNISEIINIGRGECKEIKHPTNKLELCATDTFPAFHMAKLTVMAQSCPEISILTEKQKEEKKKPKSGKIVIKKLTKTYERGKNFIFRTLDNNTGEPIGNIYVTFGSREGYLDSVTTSDIPAAMGEIKIPQDFNESTFYITIEGGLPEGYNKSFEILTLKPWSEYKAEKKLILSNLDVTKGKITGKVTNENGKVVSSVKVIIEVGDKRYERAPETETGKFEFETNKSGEFSLRAVRTDMDTSEFDSKWETLSIELDSDGDGVLDDVDACPDEKGPEENEGCPKLEVEIEVSKGEDEEFLPNKAYQGQIIFNDTVLDYTGKIKIDGDDVTVTEGEFDFIPKKGGKHSITFETSKYAKAKKTITVKMESNSAGFPFKMVGGAIIVVVIIILIINLIRGRGGGGRVRKPQLSLTEGPNMKVLQRRPPGAESLH